MVIILVVYFINIKAYVLVILREYDRSAYSNIILLVCVWYMLILKLYVYKMIYMHVRMMTHVTTALIWIMHVRIEVVTLPWFVYSKMYVCST